MTLRSRTSVFSTADQDGLSDRYQIGLWDSGGTLLVSTTLPSGTLRDPRTTSSGSRRSPAPILLAGPDSVLYRGALRYRAATRFCSLDLDDRIHVVG